MAQVIPAPPIPAPRGGLLAVAPSLDNLPADVFGDGWTFAPEQVATEGAGVVELDLCVGNNAPRTPAANPGPAAGEPFLVWAADECSTFGFQARDYAGRAQRLLRAQESYWVAHTLYNGLGTVNQSLLYGVEADVMTLSGAAWDLADALAELDRRLADDLRNGPGMIHLPPVMFAYAVQQDLLVRDGAVWRSPMGHLIVADAGYSGDGPAESGFAESVRWIFGTSMIYVNLGPVNVPGYDTQADRQMATDPSLNLVTLYADRMALIVWDGLELVQVPVLPIGRRSLTIDAQNTSVDTDATLIVAAADSAEGELLVRNTGAVSVFLGGADVTASDGYPLLAGEAIGMKLSDGDDLYGITSAGTGEVSWMITQAEG